MTSETELRLQNVSRWRIPYFGSWDTKSTRTKWKVVAWNWEWVTWRWTRGPGGFMIL